MAKKAARKSSKKSVSAKTSKSAKKAVKKAVGKSVKKAAPLPGATRARRATKARGAAKTPGATKARSAAKARGAKTSARHAGSLEYGDRAFRDDIILANDDGRIYHIRQSDLRRLTCVNDLSEKEQRKYQGARHLFKEGVSLGAFPVDKWLGPGMQLVFCYLVNLASLKTDTIYMRGEEEVEVYRPPVEVYPVPVGDDYPLPVADDFTLPVGEVPLRNDETV